MNLKIMYFIHVFYILKYMFQLNYVKLYIYNKYCYINLAYILTSIYIIKFAYEFNLRLL